MTFDPHSEEARRLAERMAQEGKPTRPRAKLVNLADVTPRPVEWLWPGRIPFGKLTIIAGDPGLGKSFITMDMAGRVSRGRPFPDAALHPVVPGGVVLINAEDDIADTVRPRLDALGADPSRIEALETIEWPDPETGEILEQCFTLRDLPRLEEAIHRVPDCRLVIIDPISAHLGKAVDSHRDADVRAVLRPLSDLARRLRVAVVAVAHLNKGSGKAMYRTNGSLAFNAAARSVLAVVKDPDDPTRRLVLPVKNNLAPDTAGLAYELVADSPGAVPFVRWDPTPIVTPVDELMGATVEPGAEGAVEEAKDWLEAMLADGPVPAAEILAAAERDGIRERTLNRAKKALGVKSRREGDRWNWLIPLKVAKAAKRQSPHLATMAGGSDASGDAPGGTSPDGGDPVDSNVKGGD
ncbi:MAG: AAA family ATPase [Phycisphaerales bacterium]|nr:AAA family ATPase [Phycisphaerales bacterium]